MLDKMTTVPVAITTSMTVGSPIFMALWINMMLMGMFKNSPVKRPGVYFLRAMVATRWGDRTFIIIVPGKP